MGLGRRVHKLFHKLEFLLMIASNAKKKDVLLLIQSFFDPLTFDLSIRTYYVCYSIAFA